MCGGAARGVPANIRVASLQLRARADPQGPGPEPKHIKECEARVVRQTGVPPRAACGHKGCFDHFGADRYSTFIDYWLRSHAPDFPRRQRDRDPFSSGPGGEETAGSEPASTSPEVSSPLSQNRIRPAAGPCESGSGSASPALLPAALALRGAALEVPHPVCRFASPPPDSNFPGSSDRTGLSGPGPGPGQRREQRPGKPEPKFVRS